MRKPFDKNAAAFGGLSNLKIGDCLSANDIRISFNVMSAIERGDIVLSTRNIRDCPMQALVGPIKFRPPPPHHGAIYDHLAKLLCSHPNRNAKAAASAILTVSRTDLAHELVGVGTVAPDFRDALLALDMEKASYLLDSLRWTDAFPTSRAKDLFEGMQLLERAFDAQRTAAWAWKMIHAPFDNLLLEANFQGHATVGGCLTNLEQRIADYKKARVSHDSGDARVSRKKFMFLDRYGMGGYRTKNPKPIYELFGRNKLPLLPQILERCDQQVQEIEAILAEVAQFDAAANENDPQGSRGKRLDSFLTPVSAVVILAMKCAALGQMLAGAALDRANDAPAWLVKPNCKDSRTRLEKANFFQLFLFYRGVFVEDDAKNQLRLPDKEFHCQSRVDELADLYRPGRRQAEDIVRDMRDCIGRGLYGCGPEAPGPAKAFGDKFGWRQAA